MDEVTRELLDRLSAANAPATFFVVGDIAQTRPRLVREIADRGHEVGCHGWDHRRVHRLSPAGLREDIRRSKDALEQATGRPVYGFRAPTFSVVRETAWAIDVLAESGLTYDSSIFPVRHDRYGVPSAPRTPFVAAGRDGDILELPPATLRVCGVNLPVAGGGYFRLFPLGLMRAGLRQAGRAAGPNVAMLYFHPWEFDPGQPRLPLPAFQQWRTYTGIGSSLRRLERLLATYRFRRAIDVATDLAPVRDSLPRHEFAPSQAAVLS
jgi:polysaccharide deacetylase family protein (PEP-CTERM system associated)